MIVIDGLSKRYGDVTALRPVSMTVEKGEFITLLGASGSGKTTLLQLIAGLTEPTSGSLHINGENVTWTHASKRGIGMVFQSYALFPHLTVFENVAFPLRMRKLAEGVVREKVTSALEMVKLPQVANRLPKALSGGQQQRIALARCLVYDPSIILMDEPLGALDKKLREHMQIEIKRIHRRTGTTILYVTHDQEEALSMSDKICLMRDGGIEQYGTPEQLYYEPRSNYVADFLGQPNMISGTIQSQGNGTAILIADGARLSAGAEPRLTTGSHAHLLVRPEKLVFINDAAGWDNVLECEVIDVSMIGPITKFMVQTRTGIDLLAISVSERDTRGIRVGMTVKLGWKSEDARLVEVSQ
jgi:putative spermidine/putrescine transport system ATP-binding protein